MPASSPNRAWKLGISLLGLWLFGLSLSAQTQPPPRIFSPTERLRTVHLKAVHEDVLRLNQERQTVPPLPGLHDFKAILHAHAEDSSHTGGTRKEMLAEALKAGVQVILLSDHYRPPRDFILDSWRGLHEGVLFLPGSEVRGFLVYPAGSILDRMDQPRPEFIASVTASNGLIFLSHPEERLDHPMEGLTGMEIYNRHADAEQDKAGLITLALKLLDREGLAELNENLKLYPDEMFAAQVTYEQVYIDKWDAETRIRRLTGVAANDCHHNLIFIVKMVNETTVRIGTNVDKDDGMREVNADLCPGITRLTSGHKSGDELVRVDFDPYSRSFRDVATHILAPELTEAAIRSALEHGHAFVSHDWMCDATGFSFELVSPAKALMGDEAKFAAGETLLARFPVACHIRLLRDGKLIVEMQSDRLQYSITAPGVYRVEGWLKLDGEERPWIYSNPIYLR